MDDLTHLSYKKLQVHPNLDYSHATFWYWKKGLAKSAGISANQSKDILISEIDKYRIHNHSGEVVDGDVSFKKQRVESDAPLSLETELDQIDQMVARYVAAGSKNDLLLIRQRLESASQKAYGSVKVAEINKRFQEWMNKFDKNNPEDAEILQACSRATCTNKLVESLDYHVSSSTVWKIRSVEDEDSTEDFR